MSAVQNIQNHPVVLQAKSKAIQFHTQLDKELTKYPAFQTLEQNTGIPKTYVFLGGLSLLATLHTLNALAAPVSNFVGFALPAYLSFKAIESPSVNDDVQWLTYWVVFGFLNFLESLALRIVLYYIPWYFAFKTIFIIWLQLPQTRGAQATYLNLLKPVLGNLACQSHAVAPTTSSTGAADSHNE